MTQGYKHLWVIDDEKDIRDSLRQVLELEGYSVSEASNGREALTLLENRSHPCLILLDLIIPVMDGWRFVDVLKSDELHKCIPVVLITSLSDKDINISCSVIVKKTI